jgi:hypothetical protein
VFYGFNQVGSHSKSSYTSVDLTRHFRSTADYRNVKEFYSGSLEKDGWILAAENVFGANGNRELIFKKGQFSISIFHSKGAPEYDYAIDLVWSSRN